MARPTLYVRRAATVATAIPVLMAEAFDFDLVRGAPAGKFELTGASRSISRTITDPLATLRGLAAARKRTLNMGLREFYEPATVAGFLISRLCWASELRVFLGQ